MLKWCYKICDFTQFIWHYNEQYAWIESAFDCYNFWKFLWVAGVLLCATVCSHELNIFRNDVYSCVSCVLTPFPRKVSLLMEQNGGNVLLNWNFANGYYRNLNWMPHGFYFVGIITYLGKGTHKWQCRYNVTKKRCHSCVIPHKIGDTDSLVQEKMQTKKQANKNQSHSVEHLNEQCMYDGYLKRLR